MDISVLQEQKNILILHIKNTDPVTVNTLRRAMVAEVPTFAISQVRFIKNTSALFHEIIAHRLGLVPLTTPEEALLDTPQEVIISLNCEGPLTVYSSHLKTTDDSVKPAYSKIPLVTLLKDQELQFEAKVELGVGKKHIKHAPALVYYRGYPQFIIEKKTGVKAVVDTCPVVEKNNSLHVTDFLQWNEVHEKMCHENGIHIENSEKEFVMTIESWGNMSPKHIFAQALVALDKQLAHLYDDVKKT